MTVDKIITHEEALKAALLPSLDTAPQILQTYVMQQRARDKAYEEQYKKDMELLDWCRKVAYWQLTPSHSITKALVERMNKENINGN